MREEKPKPKQRTLFDALPPYVNEKKEETVKPDIVEFPLTEGDRLFGLFYTKVVENLGVTPMVFSDLVKQYTKEQISQAIWVTQRAKINGTIKTNTSGFFVQALKNGYTDRKEQIDKKKLQGEIKQQEVQKWLIELNDLEMEEGAKMREKIRELVAENPNIREQAILSLSQNEVTKGIVKRASMLLNRPLEQEDYRQDKVLRELVMLAIVEQNKAAFSTIVEEYVHKIATLQKKIKENK